jgi:hypothetical protein
MAESLSRTPRFGSIARRTDGPDPSWSRRESLALSLSALPGPEDPSRAERPLKAGPRGYLLNHQKGAPANQQVYPLDHRL